MEKRIEGGYILLARKILTSDIWHKPPLYFKLWVWMIEKANHKPWKNLDRGQFKTTIYDMQVAMAYKVGYRKVTPKRGEIRGAYEALTNNHMIRTAKTTRGMIITILNYKTYQTPKNYEQHNEETTNNQVGTHYIQETKETTIIKNKQLVGSVPLKDKSEYEISAKYKHELSLAYPSVNFEKEIKKIRAWCISNQDKQKTRRGATRFINGWFSRAQEKFDKEKTKGYEPKYEVVN